MHWHSLWVKKRSQRWFKLNCCRHILMLPLLESVCLAAMSGQFNCHISKKQGQREEPVCVCESVSHLKGNYSACAACACRWFHSDLRQVTARRFNALGCTKSSCHNSKSTLSALCPHPHPCHVLSFTHLPLPSLTLCCKFSSSSSFVKAAKLKDSSSECCHRGKVSAVSVPSSPSLSLCFACHCVFTYTQCSKKWEVNATTTVDGGAAAFGQL